MASQGRDVAPQELQENIDSEGLQVNMDSEGLQVDLDAEGLELNIEAFEGLHVVNDSPGKEVVPELSLPKATITGLRKRTFWALLIGISIIIGVIGGSVGTTLKNKSSPSASTSTSSSTTTQTTTATLSFPTPAIDTALTVAYWSTASPQPQVFSMCLFYQSNSGGLWGRFWNSTFGWASDPFPVGYPPITARRKTPLAQATWSTTGGSQEIQLFYISTDGTISNAIFSGGKWTQDIHKPLLTQGGHDVLSIPPGKDVKLGASISNLAWDGPLLLYFNSIVDRGQPVSNTSVIAVAYGKEYGTFNLSTNIIPADGAGVGVLSFLLLNLTTYVEFYTQEQGHGILGCRWIFSSLKDYMTSPEGSAWVGCNPIFNSSGLYDSVIPLGTSLVITSYSYSRKVFFVGEVGVVKEMYLPSGVAADNWDVWGSRTVIPKGAGNRSIAAAQWQDFSRVVYQKDDGKLGEMELKTVGDLLVWESTGFSM